METSGANGQRCLFTVASAYSRICSLRLRVFDNNADLLLLYFSLLFFFFSWCRVNAPKTVLRQSGKVKPPHRMSTTVFSTQFHLRTSSYSQETFSVCMCKLCAVFFQCRAQPDIKTYMSQFSGDILALTNAWTENEGELARLLKR